MYAKILVGFDGSTHARDALALAADLTELTGASLVLVHAMDRGPGWETDEALRDEAARVLAAAAAVLPATLDVDRRVVIGRSVARALAEEAEAVGADLIVLGAAHRGAIGRVLAGSVARQILDGAPCAVAIAPGGYRERDRSRPWTIGVGVDGEPDSRAALAVGTAMAEPGGARLLVMAVVAPPNGRSFPYGAPDLYPALEAMARDHTKAIVERALASLPSTVRADSELLAGPIGPALEAASEAAALDLLIVGSRGFGPVRRVILGSVSAHLVATAPCALIVVPRAASALGSESVPPARPAVADTPT